MRRIRALPERILATQGDFGEHTTQGGIIVPDTNGKSSGIVPRWFRVFEVGSNVHTVSPGQWVLVEHGRWTAGLEIQDDRLNKGDRVWQLDPKGILGVSDDEPRHRGTGYNQATAWT